MTKLILVCVAALVLWMVLSQMIAWLISGPDEEAVLETWFAVFMLVPMLSLYGLIYVLSKMQHWMFPLWTDDVTFGDVVF
jgi:hypothetical protein